MDIMDLLKVLNEYRSKYPHRGIEIKGELQVVINPYDVKKVHKVWLGEKDETQGD